MQSADCKVQNVVIPHSSLCTLPLKSRGRELHSRKQRLWASLESHSPRSEIGQPSRSTERCWTTSDPPAFVLADYGVAAFRSPLRSERRLVESMGIAPISTCLQGRCITCLPRPHWQAVWVLPPASRVLETPPHRWCPACLKSGAAAGNCTRTSSVAGRYSRC